MGHESDVGQVRHIAENTRPFGKQAGRQQGQRRIFRTADPDRTGQPLTAAYDEFIHSALL